MQSAEDTKSTGKNSSHQSEDRKRRRPSLFPIRNSAKRKSSLSDQHHIFDPHDQYSNSTKITKQMNQNDIFDTRQSKSQSQFQYRTPTLNSECSTPRTTRTSPKDFIADTPFVPFVHQSITKTVWESEEIIPQQKDDIQRKQSQTQPQQNYKISQAVKQQIFQSSQSSNYNRSNPNYQQQPYANQQMVNNNQSLIKNQPQQNNLYPLLQPYIAISITIPKSQQNPSNNTLLISQVTSISNNETITKQQGILKQQTCIEQNNNQFQTSNQIQHNVFVSRAPFYYEQQKSKISQSQYQIKSSFQQPVNQVKVKQLSFSYIDCISIRSVVKNISQQYQQTSPKKMIISPISNIDIKPKQKCEKQVQFDRKNYHISNKMFENIKSLKKQNSQTQTSILQRLKIISQKYEQKIGIPRTYLQRGDQTKIQTSSCSLQTQTVQKKVYTIHQQVNFSINHDYQQKVDEKLTQLQKYIKNLYDTKQEQMNILRNRKSVDKQINTQIFVQAVPQSSQKIINRKITINNVGCQYDPKDFGNQRSSLKRVSIADTKIIYELDDSNSTQTFEVKSNKKQQKKQKKAQKSKQKDKSKKKQVKIQQRSQQQSESYMPEETIQTRKSKRKASKTPKKKSKN